MDMGADPAALNLQQEMNSFFSPVNPSIVVHVFGGKLHYIGNGSIPGVPYLRDEHPLTSQLKGSPRSKGVDP